jgi:hypothetical protein
MNHINLNNNHISNDTFKHKIDEKLIDLEKNHWFWLFNQFLVYILQILNIPNKLWKKKKNKYVLFKKTIFGQPQKSKILLGDYL